MDEAGRFDHLLIMHGGRVLASGSPAQLHQQTGTTDLDAAFIALLPAELRQQHHQVEVPPLQTDANTAVAIAAEQLSMQFGDFTAVDRVSFQSARARSLAFWAPMVVANLPR